MLMGRQSRDTGDYGSVDRRIAENGDRARRSFEANSLNTALDCRTAAAVKHSWP